MSGERTTLHLENGPNLTPGQRVTVTFHADPSHEVEFIVVGVKTRRQFAHDVEYLGKFDEVELQQVKRVEKQ